MNKAQPGSVSSATLRPQDLIPAFFAELQYLNAAKANELEEVYQEVFDAEDYDHEDDIYLIEALEDALNDHAPEGHYFGAHWGDGADFGFWPLEDEKDDEMTDEDWEDQEIEIATQFLVCDCDHCKNLKG